MTDTIAVIVGEMRDRVRNGPSVWNEHTLAWADRLAALGDDTKRLDFLDRMNAALNQRYGTDYGWQLILSPMIVRLMSDGGMRLIDLNDQHGGDARHKSCRNAIDAAMTKDHTDD
jgi:hypothetical protein